MMSLCFNTKSLTFAAAFALCVSAFAFTTHDLPVALPRDPGFPPQGKESWLCPNGDQIFPTEAACKAACGKTACTTRILK